MLLERGIIKEATGFLIDKVTRTSINQNVLLNRLDNKHVEKEERVLVITLYKNTLRYLKLVQSVGLF